MLIINKQEFVKFEPLVKELDWHLSSSAVINCNNPGKVYSNLETDPQAVFVTSPEGCYLAGDPDQAGFKSYLQSFLERDFLKQQNNFELIFLPKWKDTVIKAFNNIRLSSYKRFHYVIKKEQYKEQKEQMGPDKKPIPVNSSFVRNNLDRQNMKHVNSWILQNWGSYENFEEKGFGRYILSGKKVISWSICDCVSDDRCEIGIWSDPEHRLQGNATAVVKAMLLHAFKHGFKEVGWHCSWDNAGSYKTAETCGFVREREYLSYYPVVE
ncbi:GNAT family N-acetyltransferase [Candidatus Cloacimonadota bacterium]